MLNIILNVSLPNKTGNVYQRAENIEGIQYNFSEFWVSSQAKPSDNSRSSARFDRFSSQSRFFLKNETLTWPPLVSAFCRITVWSMDNSPGTDCTRYLSPPNGMSVKPLPLTWKENAHMIWKGKVTRVENTLWLPSSNMKSGTYRHHWCIQTDGILHPAWNTNY